MHHWLWQKFRKPPTHDLDIESLVTLLDRADSDSLNESATVRASKVGVAQASSTPSEVATQSQPAGPIQAGWTPGDAARLISVLDEIESLPKNAFVTAEGDARLRVLDIQFGVLLKRLGLAEAFKPPVKPFGDSGEILPNCRLAVWKNPNMLRGGVSSSTAVDDSNVWHAHMQALRNVVLDMQSERNKVEADANRGGGEPPTFSQDTPPHRNRKKRGRSRGEGRDKLIAALNQHHKYSDGGCLNQEPIGNNNLARLAGVAKRTASAFFKQEFKGHEKYVRACSDKTLLLTALKLLNKEFSPHLLYGGAPPENGEREGEGKD